MSTHSNPNPTEKTPLGLIQKLIEAPKSKQTQGSGRFSFKYRNAEMILSAAKKHMSDADVLLMDDSIETIGNVLFVKCVARFNEHSATGYAALDLTRKDMNLSQATGSAASYARKYALGSLFAIDDNEDADDHSQRKPQRAQQTQQAPTQPQKRPLAMSKVAGIAQRLVTAKKPIEAAYEHFTMTDAVRAAFIQEYATAFKNASTDK